jgi:monomeric isocitrate dehydrogenase
MNNKINQALKFLAEGIKDKESQDIYSFSLHLSSSFMKVSDSLEEYQNLITIFVNNVLDIRYIDFERRKNNTNNPQNKLNS